MFREPVAPIDPKAKNYVVLSGEKLSQSKAEIAAGKDYLDRHEQANELFQRAVDEQLGSGYGPEKKEKAEDISFEKLLGDTESDIVAIRKEYETIDGMGRNHGNFLSSIQKAEEMVATTEGYLKRGLSRLGEKRDDTGEKVAVARAVTTLAELKQSIGFLRPAGYKPEK